ncbi:putative polyvalent protein kinase domain-containing protein [Bacteroides bouchesdurhonensis]
MDRTHSSVNSLLEQAACIVRRSKKAAGTLKPTESYKRGQIEELISFADLNCLWIDFNNFPVIYLDKGGENEVFYDGAATVYKLNNFEYAGDNLENFFIRITAHNKFFGNVPYQMVGFAYNSLHEFCAVLIQPHIKAEREATENEIANYMQALGFEMDYLDEFHNDQYEVFDAVPNNVLYGIDRELYFIDTQIRLKKKFI